MNIPSQHYAALANDSYQDRHVGVRSPPYSEQVTVDGVEYRVREHVDNVKTGYQGTIYQRVDTGEMVVAHRGTEQIWKDGVVTDGAMVTRRTNPQADDAVELTRRAMAYARQDGQESGRQPPAVSVTGHSLGGTLAQVSAHHFDLRGETFNAYGAASLDRRIPEGGSRMLNHVMAADAVSSASPHYGQVRIYATEREISVLQQAGYHDRRLRDVVTPDFPLVAAGRSLGSHSMHNFLPVDGDGNADRSVLGDPATTARAAAHDRAIQNFRSDIEVKRVGTTMLTRSGAGLIQDGIDYLRGPVPAGEPARREQEEASRNRGGGRASVESPENPVTTKYARADGVPAQDYVARLLGAARGGDPDNIRTALEELQASPAGQAWQHKVDREVMRLANQEETQRQATLQQDAVRHV